MRLTRVKCSFLVSKWKTWASLPPSAQKERSICKFFGDLVNRKSLHYGKYGKKSIGKNSVHELWSSLIKQRLAVRVREQIYRKKINLWISPVLMFSIFEDCVRFYCLRREKKNQNLEFHVDHLQDHGEFFRLCGLSNLRIMFSEGLYMRHLTEKIKLRFLLLYGSFHSRYRSAEFRAFSVLG